MAIELRWLASLSASAFHAAQALVQERPLVDEALEDALAEPTHLLVEEIESIGIDGARAIELLASLAMGIENNRELVDVVITKLKGRRDSDGRERAPRGGARWRMLRRRSAERCRMWWTSWRCEASRCGSSGRPGAPGSWRKWDG